jgi:hypothetical protein
MRKYKRTNINLVGRKFNLLTVLEEVGRDKHGSVLWKCKCDCGGETILSTHLIYKGYIKSCGCLMHASHIMSAEARMKISIARKFDIKDLTLITKIRQIKRGAERRNIEYLLSDEVVNGLIYSPCFYCGYIPEGTHSNKLGEYNIINGIDRVDNSKGYIEGNVVASCRDCNVKKKDITIDMIEKIYKFVHNKNLKEELYEKEIKENVI